jgi:hypothetical protein
VQQQHQQQHHQQQYHQQQAPPPSTPASILASQPGLMAMSCLPPEYQQLARLAASQASGAASEPPPSQPSAPAPSVPSAAAFAAQMASASPSMARLQPSTPIAQEVAPPAADTFRDMLKTLLKDSVRDYLK